MKEPYRKGKQRIHPGLESCCGQRNSDGAFIVWRITAKKRMVAKLKALKAALQRRKHHRTTAVGAWLRKVVLGYYQYPAVPGNSTQLGIFRRRVGWLWRGVLVRRSQRAQVRWDRLSPVLNRWIPPPVFCILILMLASPPPIHDKSRMRESAGTDLCGGRSAMVVPTATTINERDSGKL
jgi:hypothetical protein